MSLPNQYCSDGGFRRFSGATPCGSIVPSHGAKIAMRIMMISTMPPAMAVGCRRSASFSRCEGGDIDSTIGRASVAMSVPDPWIEKHVTQIDGEIDQNVGRGEDQDDALNDRIIAPQDRVDGETADSRDCENRFRDDRAADEQRDADADDGHYRHGRILERVSDEY